MTNQSSNRKQDTRAARGSMRRMPARMQAVQKADDVRGALFRLVAYFKAFRSKLILVFVLVTIYTLLSLLGPYLMGVAIDDFISNKELDGLASIALIMLGIFLISGLFQYAANWIMADISQEALKKMRQNLFDHLQSLSLRFFDKHGAGELMSRLTNDIDAINQAVSSNVTSLFASILSLVGILIAMFILNFWLALASVIVVPIMFWFTNFVAKYTRKGFRDLQKELGNLNGIVEETISGQRVVNAFRRNDTAMVKFKEYNTGVYKAGLYANTYALLLMPLTNQLGNLFVIVLAGLGGFLALQGLVTIGIIATFISYGRQFIQPVRQLANMYNSIQAAIAGAERVFEIMDVKPELKDIENAVSIEVIQGKVEFKDVGFAYVEGVPVIKNMSLHAKPGETIALVGPTGAGKTTLINLLTRFYDIDSGSIRIDGVDLRNLVKDDLRKQLGIVLQDTFLFADTVMENIRYGRMGATDEDCIEAAKMADAHHYILQLPQGYQTNLSERARNLSQGQRQLLAIARALLANPSILILDEATSSVDTRTEARIQESLLRLMEGRTSFVIAHRLSTIREADNLIVINDGEIIEQGDHDSLMEKVGFYHNLFMSQFKGQKI